METHAALEPDGKGHVFAQPLKQDESRLATDATAALGALGDEAVRAFLFGLGCLGETRDLDNDAGLLPGRNWRAGGEENKTHVGGQVLRFQWAAFGDTHAKKLLRLARETQQSPARHVRIEAGIQHADVSGSDSSNDEIRVGMLEWANGKDRSLLHSPHRLLENGYLAQPSWCRR